MKLVVQSMEIRSSKLLINNIARKREVKNMQIYMEPLMDELLELYEKGILAFDVSSLVGDHEFTLKATVLWTIHDWLGT